MTMTPQFHRSQGLNRSKIVDSGMEFGFSYDSFRGVCAWATHSFCGAAAHDSHWYCSSKRANDESMKFLNLCPCVWRMRLCSCFHFSVVAVVLTCTIISFRSVCVRFGSYLFHFDLMSILRFWFERVKSISYINYVVIFRPIFSCWAIRCLRLLKEPFLGNDV